jgi:uncharacterized small protein (DUF1192 family)
MDRLIRFGLVDTFPSPENPEDRLVTVSAEGLATLKAWLKPPITEEDIAHSADFVRLRTFFLGVIEPSERIALLEDALGSMKLHLQRCREQFKQSEVEDDEFGPLAMLSIVYETEARIAWLEVVLAKLKASGASKVGEGL